MNAFFFCLEGTAVMEEFSDACPHGCCVSLLSPLEKVTIKGRKKIMGEREHSGASLREIPGASGTELDASAWLLLVFQGSYSHPFTTPRAPSSTPQVFPDIQQPLLLHRE